MLKFTGNRLLGKRLLVVLAPRALAVAAFALLASMLSVASAQDPPPAYDGDRAARQPR